MSANDGPAQRTSVPEANAPSGSQNTLQGDPSSVETSECITLVSGLEQDSQVSYHLDIQKNILTLTDHSGQVREFPIEVAYQLQVGKQLKSFTSYLTRINVQIVKKSTGEFNYRRIRANAQPPEQTKPEAVINWLMDQNTKQIEVNNLTATNVQKCTNELTHVHTLIEQAKEEAARRDADLADELTTKMNELGENLKKCIRDMMDDRSRSSRVQQWINETEDSQTDFGPGIVMPEYEPIEIPRASPV